jgi:hypothetical protein
MQSNVICLSSVINLNENNRSCLMSGCSVLIRIPKYKQQQKNKTNNKIKQNKIKNKTKKNKKEKENN